MPSVFFYIFASLAGIGAIALIAFRNPVSSALSMVASFIGLAALFIGLNAYFVGIIQILVYAGAIMVLFLFIIMLLDLKAEERKKFKPTTIAAGIIIPLLFLLQVSGALVQIPGGDHKPLALEEAAENFDEKSEIRASLEDGSLPDVNLIGLTMFGSKGDNDSLKTPGYNFPLQVVGVLLLVATVGVVALSRRPSKKPEPTNE